MTVEELFRNALTVEGLIDRLESMVLRNPDVLQMPVAFMTGDPETCQVVESIGINDGEVCFDSEANSIKPPFIHLNHQP